MGVKDGMLRGRLRTLERLAETKCRYRSIRDLSDRELAIIVGVDPDQLDDVTDEELAAIAGGKGG